MAESDEHKFLSTAVTEFLEGAASTGLYAFLENQRKRFDFGCNLLRDWTRPVIGQTLWRHEEGVDKDLRTLLADEQAEVCIYVARDTVKARNIFAEAVSDFRSSFADARLYRLRPIWIPSDFQAGSSEQEAIVRELVEENLARDVLLNVVLGGLTRESIRLFISSTGRVGLDLAILYDIATRGFTNLRALAERTRTSKSGLPERLVRLVGCGFLTQPRTDASFYFTPTRGRVFLELCRSVVSGAPSGPELERILRLLGLVDQIDMSVAQSGLGALRLRIRAAIDEFEVDLESLDYSEFWDSVAWPPGVDRPADMQAAEWIAQGPG